MEQLAARVALALLTEELRQELAANGIPMPKPFAITRQTPSKH
jgi:hypothetical protein